MIKYSLPEVGFHSFLIHLLPGINLAQGDNIMGQQINKIEKRRRRKAYLERVAERAKAAAKKK